MHKADPSPTKVLVLVPGLDSVLEKLKPGRDNHEINIVEGEVARKEIQTYAFSYMHTCSS